MNPIATTVWTCECGMFHRTEEAAIGCCLCERCDEPRQKPYIYCTEHLREHDEARKAEERAKALAAPFAPVDYAGWVYIPDGDIFAENAEMAAEAYWIVGTAEEPTRRRGEWWMGETFGSFVERVRMIDAPPLVREGEG